MDNVKKLCRSALKIRATIGTRKYLCFGIDFFAVGKVTLYMGDYNIEFPIYELKNIEYIG